MFVWLGVGLSLIHIYRLGKYQWICMALLLGFAYGGPALGWAIPVPVSAALMLICLPAGLMAMRQIVSFDAYRAVNQQMLSQLMTQMDSPAQISKQMSEKSISADTTLTLSLIHISFHQIV